MPLGERPVLRYDILLSAVILFLTLLGLVTLYSASYLFALNQPVRFKDGLAPISSNIIAFVIMLVLFPILALSGLDWLKKDKMVVVLVFLTIAFNVLPFFPFFQKSSHRPGIDAMRWIVIKRGGRDAVSFQPSEMIKIVLPLYLAYILEKNDDRLNKLVYGPLPPLIVTAVFCVLVLRQDNFSEAFLIALTGFIICFAAGIRLRYFILSLFIMLPVAYKLTFGNKTGRWFGRLASFMQPGTDPFGTGYQIQMSKDAIKSGVFWGKGMGQGTLKTRMPEVHGDFVFASYAEESGLLGVIIYIVLIGIFAWLGYVVAWRSRDRFSQLFAFGLVTPIVAQTLLNIAVVAEIIPTTGVPLPFVSSGGSSLLMTLVGAALLVNAARQHILSVNMGGQNAG